MAPLEPTFRDMNREDDGLMIWIGQRMDDGWSARGDASTVHQWRKPTQSLAVSSDVVDWIMMELMIKVWTDAGSTFGPCTETAKAHVASAFST